MSPAGVVDAVVDLLLLWGKFMLEKKKKKTKCCKVPDDAWFDIMRFP